MDTVRMSTGSLIRVQLSRFDDDTFLFQIGQSIQQANSLPTGGIALIEKETHMLYCQQHRLSHNIYWIDRFYEMNTVHLKDLVYFVLSILLEGLENNYFLELVEHNHNHNFRVQKMCCGIN